MNKTGEKSNAMYIFEKIIRDYVNSISGKLHGYQEYEQRLWDYVVNENKILWILLCFLYTKQGVTELILEMRHYPGNNDFLLDSEDVDFYQSLESSLSDRNVKLPHQDKYSIFILRLATLGAITGLFSIQKIYYTGDHQKNKRDFIKSLSQKNQSLLFEDVILDYTGDKIAKFISIEGLEDHSYYDLYPFFLFTSKESYIEDDWSEFLYFLGEYCAVKIMLLGEKIANIQKKLDTLIRERENDFGDQEEALMACIQKSTFQDGCLQLHSFDILQQEGPIKALYSLILSGKIEVIVWDLAGVKIRILDEKIILKIKFTQRQLFFDFSNDKLFKGDEEIIIGDSNLAFLQDFFDLEKQGKVYKNEILERMESQFPDLNTEKQKKIRKGLENRVNLVNQKLSHYFSGEKVFKNIGPGVLGIAQTGFLERSKATIK